MFSVVEKNLQRTEGKGFDSLLGKVGMMTQASGSEERRIAEMAREACIRAALAGYENAAMSGLCHEGAWEAAISAIRMLDLENIIKEKGRPQT